MEILTVRHCEQKYVAVSVEILMCENNVMLALFMVILLHVAILTKQV